MQDFVVV
jgi:hypothetical protein